MARVNLIEGKIKDPKELNPRVLKFVVKWVSQKKLLNLAVPKIFSPKGNKSNLPCSLTLNPPEARQHPSQN